MYAASAQALVFIVVAVAGDEELGTLRAGQVYFAPLSLFVTALSVIANCFDFRRYDPLAARAKVTGCAVQHFTTAC